MEPEKALKIHEPTSNNSIINANFKLKLVDIENSQKHFCNQKNNRK